jgi:hypothetical protein
MQPTSAALGRVCEDRTITLGTGSAPLCSPTSALGFRGSVLSPWQSRPARWHKWNIERRGIWCPSSPNGPGPIDTQRLELLLERLSAGSTAIYDRATARGTQRPDWGQNTLSHFMMMKGHSDDHISHMMTFAFLPFGFQSSDKSKHRDPNLLPAL